VYPIEGQYLNFWSIGKHIPEMASIYLSTNPPTERTVSRIADVSTAGGVDANAN